MSAHEIPSSTIIDAKIADALTNHPTKKDVDDAMKLKQDVLTQSQTNAVNSGVTSGLVNKLKNIEDGAQKNPDLSPYAKKTDVEVRLSRKQDRLLNHQLEAIDSGITHEKVEKLNSVEKGAQKNPDLSPYAKIVDVDNKLDTKLSKENVVFPNLLNTESAASSTAVAQFYREKSDLDYGGDNGYVFEVAYKELSYKTTIRAYYYQIMNDDANHYRGYDIQSGITIDMYVYKPPAPIDIFMVGVRVFENGKKIGEANATTDNSIVIPVIQTEKYVITSTGSFYIDADRIPLASKIHELVYSESPNGVYNPDEVYLKNGGYYFIGNGKKCTVYLPDENDFLPRTCVIYCYTPANVTFIDARGRHLVCRGFSSTHSSHSITGKELKIPEDKFFSLTTRRIKTTDGTELLYLEVI